MDDLVRRLDQIPRSPADTVGQIDLAGILIRQAATEDEHEQEFYGGIDEGVLHNLPF